MVFKTFFKACAKLALYMTAGFLGGLLVATVIAVLDGDPAPKAVSRCPAADVDDYHFQKLETFVDPRDSNEYTVLKFAEYRGCTMSERDPGFLAGDTVTFHLMLENLRYETKSSICLDSTCERGRYYPFGDRWRICPAGWTIASAMQNAGYHIFGGRMQDYPTFSPIKVVDPDDASGLRRLRARPHDGTLGWVDTVYLNLSGFYNIKKGAFEFVDSLSVVWTGDAFATVIMPNAPTEEQKAWAADAMSAYDRMKVDNLYPVRCIRIDDPNHNMDTQKANMETYYNNMRMLPYLFR